MWDVHIVIHAAPMLFTLSLRSLLSRLFRAQSRCSKAGGEEAAVSLEANHSPIESPAAVGERIWAREQLRPHN